MARPSYDQRVLPKTVRALYGRLKGPNLRRLYIEVRYLLFEKNPAKVAKELREWDATHPDDNTAQRF